MIDRLGNPHRFLSPSDPLRELSPLGKRVNQPDSRQNRGQTRLAEPLAAKLALKGVDVALEAFTRTTMVAKDDVGLPQAQICHDLEGEIFPGLGDGKGAAAGCHSSVEVTR